MFEKASVCAAVSYRWIGSSRRLGSVASEADPGATGAGCFIKQSIINICLQPIRLEGKSKGKSRL